RGFALLLAWRFGPAGWIGGELIGFLVAIGFLFRPTLADLRPERDPVLGKDLLRAGIALLPMLFAHWVMIGADRYVMLLMLPDATEAIGLYTVGERIGTIVQLANVAFTLGWQRYAFENFLRRDGAERVSHGLTLYVLLAGYLTMALALLGDDLTHWVMPAAYEGGMAVIPLVTLAGFCGGLAELVGVALQRANQSTKLSALTSLSAALQVGLLVLLVPTAGIRGAAAAGLACQLLKLILVAAAARKAMPIPWDVRRMGMLLAIFFGVFAAGQVFRPFGWAAATAAQSALVLATPLLLWRLDVLTDDERDRIREGWRRLTGRKA
ncbi:MAG TPA: polysaccharide biosynthesis C-terminal domain-containing protein, partial [Planctomycetia bacterium]|nr:polysaccharide biosynthesis C-terminal domain-containing protein [Planctomycetia bacterium]